MYTLFVVHLDTSIVQIIYASINIYLLLKFFFYASACLHACACTPAKMHVCEYMIALANVYVHVYMCVYMY